MPQPEISYVTWSSKEIRIVYAGQMVVQVSAEDLYPLAVKCDVASLVGCAQTSMLPVRSKETRQ
jgi:hypothetical protein